MNERKTSRKGIAFIYDAIFACVVLFIALASIAASTPPPPPARTNMQGYATSVLIWMDSKDLLAPCVYPQDAQLLSSLLDRLVAGGYRLEVYLPTEGGWTLLWACTSPGFDSASASASQPYPLTGWRGVPDPRIVLLLLSP